MLTLCIIGVLVAVGVALATSRTHVDRRAALKVLALAVLLHVGLTALMLTTSLEETVKELVYGDRSPRAFLLAGLIESAGVWLPVALMPWATARTRAVSVVGVVAAGVLAAKEYYFPFDILLLNDVVVSPSRLDIVVTAVASVLVVGFGFLFGLMANWWWSRDAGRRLRRGVRC